MGRDPGRRTRDLRKPVHFRVDDENVERLARAQAALGLSQNAMFNDALDLWLSQPTVVDAIAGAPTRS